jgi:uncharacterized membrane protein YphA (DoxX/SURF4 family)
MTEILTQGLGWGAAALTINRVAVGVFFAISGYHKLFNAKRHESLVRTLVEDKVPFVRFNQWFVPIVELTAGSALLLGLYSTVAAVFLGAICLVACGVDGWERVKRWEPIDKADWLDDFLYLPEVLYGLMLLVTILAGPGSLTIT